MARQRTVPHLVVARQQFLVLRTESDGTFRVKCDDGNGNDNTSLITGYCDISSSSNSIDWRFVFQGKNNKHYALHYDVQNDAFTTQSFDTANPDSSTATIFVPDGFEGSALFTALIISGTQQPQKCIAATATLNGSLSSKAVSSEHNLDTIFVISKILN
ncbi:hypothetical protein OS493_030232 [Desmophyllum pertusum]|uniref:Uncharacterized protein n=1 Tax=Desmophyllum pertusum TaxID=174260 RepID=A0A9W9Y8V8_9CNID|nr:hypothetical protein OS493_030232 [Desmophyllum pertusum]